MALRVLIAEDDEAIALYLKQIIEEVPDIQVINISKDGKEAIRNIEIFRPSVVFLDIDMPEMDGLAVAKETLEFIPDIKLIFATAHPDYTLEAFEIYSFDYILKPFNSKRIHKTLRKIKDTLQDKQTNNMIVIHLEERNVFIDAKEILFIEGSGHTLIIKTKTMTYRTRGELSRMETKLDPRNFFRAHKGYIVNLKAVKEIVPLNRTFEMILTSGERILLSREREKLLREIYLF